MSRSNPARFVLSVAAEVAAVVFIVSVLPRVDLRTSAGAAPTYRTDLASETQPLQPRIADWPAMDDRRREAPPMETSFYQRRTDTAPPLAARELPTREPAPRQPVPLIAVDPARPAYVEQRLDRASQDLVNTVGSYVSQTATDLLQVQPTQPVPSPRTSPPALSPSFPRPPAAVTGSFPTQPQSASQGPPRPWARY